jgi:hypothetical protein
MPFRLALVLMICGFTFSLASDDADARRAGLQALAEFIGVWNGSGGPDKPRVDSKDPVWKETLDWSWRFKGDDCWLSLKITDGKHVSSGEIRYVPNKQRYTMRLIDAKKQSMDFEGKLDKGYLTLERIDSKTGDTQQLTMNTAAEGVRFVYRYAVKPKGRTLFNKVYQVGASKEGESFATSAKKNECIVTGGLGTMTVSYMGETYFVCCSGCRDAFNEDPAKFVKEFKEKKNKK